MNYKWTDKGLFKKNNEEIKIMEFGARWGFWLNYLKKNNFNVSAFEISKSRINFMKNKEINVISDLLSVKENFDFIFQNKLLNTFQIQEIHYLICPDIDSYIFLRFLVVSFSI